MYRVATLKNGLTIATAEMPHMTSVSVGIWVGVGSRYEPPPINGMCHFIEHLLFKGTQKRSAREISEAIEGIGGSLNAFTSEESTCFHARAGYERLPEVLDVLVDMLVDSRFAPAEIVKERNVIKEEIAMYWDEPQHLVHELLNQTLWPNQALGRPITGTPATLDRISRRQILDYLHRNYVSGNTVIVAAGRLKHRSVARLVSRYARRFSFGSPPTCAPVLTEQKEPRVRLFTKKTEQTQMALGIRTFSRHDDRRYALRLLNVILGENMSSRLFQAVREDRGLAYSIYSSPSFFNDTGDLVISAGLDLRNLEKTLRLIIRELRRCVASPPSPLELRRARDYVLGQIDLGCENTETQMNWVGEQLLGYARIFSIDEIKRRLRALVPGDLRALARDIFRSERLNLALVSPLRSDRRLNSLMRI